MDERTTAQKISDCVTYFVGSWRFILYFFLILSAWLTFNTITNNYCFDPYPFILLNLLLSFIAAFQAPFIMMSQNRAEAKQDRAYRGLFQELKELTEGVMELVKTDHEDEVKYRKELAALTRAMKEMVEIDHSDEVQYKKEISQLIIETHKIQGMLDNKNN